MAAPAVPARSESPPGATAAAALSINSIICAVAAGTAERRCDALSQPPSVISYAYVVVAQPQRLSESKPGALRVA